MRAPGASAEGSDVDASPRRQLFGKVLRYAAGSVVATICSEATFLLLYGPLKATPVVSSTLAWLAGAIPNYWLNRTWTWRRQGRPSLGREVIPYIAIIVATLLLAIAATGLADHLLTRAHVSHNLRVALVGGTFLGVYAVVFLLRFFLLDRMFRRAATASSPGNVSAVSTKEPS
jgi:putative flippase GtrA